jgi:hypothetical protein
LTGHLDERQFVLFLSPAKTQRLSEGKMAAFFQPILEAVFRDTQAEALRELQLVLDSKLL